MTHDPVEDLLGVYALDAVDADERAVVEAHLAECPRCRAEVDGYREVAAQLALSGAPAPSGLWDRIADAIDGSPPPPLRLIVDRTAVDRSAVDRTAVDRTADDPPARHRRWITWGGALASAAAVVAIVSLSVTSIRQQDSIDDMQQAQSLTAVANDAFASPDARIAELATTDGEVLARAAVLPDGNGYVLAEALPDLDGRTYQLWGAAGDEVISLGPLGSAPVVRSFLVDDSMNQLMITAEDEPVPAPTSAPLVAGPLH